MSAITVDQLASPRPAADASVKRDRWGRYLLPHPVTGKEQAWTRATTLAGTLADRYGLEQWDQRNVVLGIGARRDLYAQAAAATPDDTQTLNGIVSQAKEAARGKAGANLGSALHRLTERVDAGELDPATIGDPELRCDIEAYAAAMHTAGVTIVPGWLERILLVPQIDVAGTCDRLCNGLWSLPRIGDVKTGKDVVRWGMAEIPLQLAIYAHATHWYDPATRTLHDMPHVDQQTALVMHLPAGKGICTLYEVDIQAGWDAVQLAVAVRDWRKRGNLATQIPAVGSRPAAGAGESGQADATTTPTKVASADRHTWIRDRIKTIVQAGHEAALAGLWDLTLVPAPILPDTALTDPQVNHIVEWCVAVEAAIEAPFPDTDPLFAGLATADRTPEPAPPAPVDQARDELARHWADKGRQLLSEYDQAEATAIITAAELTGTEPMDADRYMRLEAVAVQAAEPDGAVIFTYSDPEQGSHGGVAVVPAPEAAARMIAAAGTRGEAKDRAARLAKTMGHIAPRSLPKAAEKPLLAALVAAGHGGVTPTSNSKEQQQ